MYSRGETQSRSSIICVNSDRSFRKRHKFYTPSAYQCAHLGVDTVRIEAVGSYSSQIFQPDLDTLLEDVGSPSRLSKMRARVSQIHHLTIVCLHLLKFMLLLWAPVVEIGSVQGSLFAAALTHWACQPARVLDALSAATPPLPACLCT